jgi:hypothetical protein
MSPKILPESLRCPENSVTSLKSPIACEERKFVLFYAVFLELRMEKVILFPYMVVVSSPSDWY